uniref:Uncharacterized protein n=1 Tax=Glossina austeni TaxID=7395 RepID=A0A1A9V2V0_GLOAU
MCGVRAPSLRTVPLPPPRKCNSFSESVILPHGFGNISPLDSQHGVGLALPTPSPLASGGKIPKGAKCQLPKTVLIAGCYVRFQSYASNLKGMSTNNEHQIDIKSCWEH